MNIFRKLKRILTRTPLYKVDATITIPTANKKDMVLFNNDTIIKVKDITESTWKKDFDKNKYKTIWSNDNVPTTLIEDIS